MYMNVRKFLSVFLTFIMVMASFVVCPTTTAYAAEFDGLYDATNYLIISSATGMAMTVEGNSTGDSAGICQMTRGDYWSQVWTLEDMEDGYCRIVNKFSNKALNVPNKSAEEGKQIIQWNKENSPNSQWKLTKLGDGSYRISPKHIEGQTFSLSVKDKSDNRGAEIVQETYDETNTYATWNFVAIDESAIKNNPALEVPQPKEAVDAFIAKFATGTEKNGILSNSGTFWSLAETVEVLIDAYERYGTEEYKDLMCEQVDAFIRQNGTNWRGNPYNDDIMWAVIMCSRTYLLTGEEKYLDYAKENFELSYERAWSDDFGGGLWWKEEEDVAKKSKNACVNGPGATAACLLGQATGDASYYEKAKKIIDWEYSVLCRKDDEGNWDGGVADSVKIVDGEWDYNGWVSTYNQGTFIGACAMLYQYYGEQKYFDWAKLAADRSVRLGSGTEGYLNGEQDNADLIGFKGILARWLGYFVVNCDVDDYNDWMYRNAASAWTNRNSDDLMWTQFGKITIDNIENSTQALNGDATVGQFAGWGCSPAVSWLVNCTDIDERQEKMKAQTESLGMSAAKTALNKVIVDMEDIYDAGQGEYSDPSWNAFKEAYEAAKNYDTDITVAELKSMQATLEETHDGLKMKNPPGKTIEMESGECSQGVGISDAGDCSGGKRVGNVKGTDQTVNFMVTADKAGEHVISIWYCTQVKRNLVVWANGTDYEVSCDGTGGWDKPSTAPVEVTVYLKKGENAIVFGGLEGEDAPNLDYFVYNRTNSAENIELDEAMESLASVTATTKALYDAGQQDYTDESWNALKAAYEAAMNPPADANAEDVKLLEEALTKAQSELTKKPAKPNSGQGGTENDINSNSGQGGKENDINPDSGQNETDNSTNTNKNNTTNDETTVALTEEESAIANQLGVTPETAQKISAIAQEYNIPEDTLYITDTYIKSLKSDGDVKGSSFVKIQAKASKQTKSSVSLKWNKVKGADGYLIYGNKSGKKNAYKLIKTITSGKKTSYTQKKLKKGTYYKYIVCAYKNVDDTKVTLAASKTIHTVTKGGKYGVAKSVKVKSTKVNLKVGKTYNLSVKEVKADKKIKKYRKLCYESSNKKIATVSKKGKITAKKQGTCYIYVYAQNGVYKKIKVKVKKLT